MHTGTPLLSLKSLAISQDGRSALFHPISRDFFAGEQVLLTGDNGVGKSSLFKLLSGFGRLPFILSGSLNYHWQGKAWSKCPSSAQFLTLASNQVIKDITRIGTNTRVMSIIAGGLVTNSYCFSGALTPEQIEAIEHLTEQLEINHLLSQPYGALSSGQKALVILAQALLPKPAVLILDEIEQFIQINRRESLLEVMRQYLSDECLLLAASHSSASILFDHFSTLHLTSVDAPVQVKPQETWQALSTEDTEFKASLLVEINNADFYLNDKQVLKAIQFQVAAQDFIVLEGAMGAGKTTLLEVIYGRHQPVDKDGAYIRYPFLKKRRPLLSDRKKCIGFAEALSDYRVLGHNAFSDKVGVERYLIAGVNGDWPLSYTDDYHLTDRDRMIIDVMQLNTLLSMRLSDLSSGQRRWIELARSFVGAKKLLLLDEPFNNLDAGKVEMLTEILLRLNRKFGVAIVIAAHDCPKLPYRRCVLDSGQIVAA